MDAFDFSPLPVIQIPLFTYVTKLAPGKQSLAWGYICGGITEDVLIGIGNTILKSVNTTNTTAVKWHPDYCIMNDQPIDVVVGDIKWEHNSLLIVANRSNIPFSVELVPMVYLNKLQGYDWSKI